MSPETYDAATSGDQIGRPYKAHFFARLTEKIVVRLLDLLLCLCGK